MTCRSLLKLVGIIRPSLHEAVLDGNLRIMRSTVRRLAEKKPEGLSARDEAGRTALDLSIKIMREDIAEVLIACPDVDVAARDPRTGQTPLHFAVQQQLNSTVLKLFYRGEVDVNAQDKAGMTPLMIACNMGHRDMVILLLEVLHSSVDMMDTGGWTALFYAVHTNQGDLAEILVSHGANLSHKDNKDMTAVDWAEELEHGELCAFLEDFRPSVV